MSCKPNKFIFLFIFLTVFQVRASENRIINIEEVLQLAQDNSPSISAAQFDEIAAKKAIKIARAGLYPLISFEAIETEGFAGSSSIMDIQGVMGSPYRKGLSGGLVVKQMIYDFGRTLADIKRSKYQVDYAKQNTRVTAYEVKLLALSTFYECARFRTQRDIWKVLGDKSKIITKEAKNFVKTGQRSIVDNYLSQAQTEEALTNNAYFSERLKGSIQELVVLLGLKNDSFSCPSLTIQKPIVRSDPQNPFVERAKMGAKIAKAQYQRERANLYPQIVSFASVGAMQKVRLVDKKDYAVGIGLIFPLYDLSTIGGIQRARAIVLAKNKEIEAEKQYTQDLNAKYDTIINASGVRLRHLTEELTLAREAFDLAKKRYFLMEGQLIDLREAFRNLARVEVETEDTRANLLQAQGGKALLNGEGSTPKL